MRLSEILTHERVVSGSTLDGHSRDSVKLVTEPERVGGGAMAPLEAEQHVGDPPAVVDVADDVVLRCLGVGEEHLVEVVPVVDVDDRAHFDAGLVHRHQQERDAAVLGLGGVGAAQHEDPVGGVAAGSPDLLAVDHPFVAVEHGARAQVGEVRAAVGLAVTLAPAVLARDDLGQEVALLLLGTALDDGVADHRDAEPVVVAADGHPSFRELLGHHDTLDLAEPGAAVFDRP